MMKLLVSNKSVHLLVSHSSNCLDLSNGILASNITNNSLESTSFLETFRLESISSSYGFVNYLLSSKILLVTADNVSLNFGLLLMSSIIKSFVFGSLQAFRNRLITVLLRNEGFLAITCAICWPLFYEWRKVMYPIVNLLMYQILSL